MKRGTPDHPKMLALARALSIPKAHAVGLMETLWHWVSRFAPQGDIGKWSDEAIAAGADWEGDASRFVGGLIASRWLDASEDYRLLVHDWHEHCDDATRKYLIRAKLPFLTADNGGQRRTTADNGGQRQPRARALPTPTPTPAPTPTPTPQGACVSPDDLGDLIQATAAAMRARHAKTAGTGGLNLERKLTEIASKAVDPCQTLKSIDRRHQGAVEREWRGWEPRYIPRLLQWLEEERYLDPIPNESPPDRLELARRALE